MITVTQRDHRALRAAIYRAAGRRLAVAGAIVMALGYAGQAAPALPAAAPAPSVPAATTPAVASAAALTVPAGASLVATARRSVVRAVNPTGTHTWSLRNPTRL